MLFSPPSFFSSVTKQHVEQRLFRGIPAAHLFRIVQNVDAYKEFLPLCTESRVTQRISPHEFYANLTVGMNAGPLQLTETYTSHVTAQAQQPHQFVINAQSVQSSKWIEALSSQWKLTPQNLTAAGTSNNTSRTPENVLVDFQVSLTTSDPIISQTLDQVLKHVAQQQVQAFEQRCRQLPIEDPNSFPSTSSTNQQSKG